MREKTHFFRTGLMLLVLTLIFSVIGFGLISADAAEKKVLYVGDRCTLYCNGSMPTFVLSDWKVSGSAVSIVARNGESCIIEANRPGTATVTGMTQSKGIVNHPGYRMLGSWIPGWTEEQYATSKVEYTICVAERKSLKAPKITGISNTSSGIKVTWSKISGADKYRLFRYNGSSYSTVGTTTATGFTDTNVASGTKYTYAVRCMDGTGSVYWSGYSGKKSLTYIAQPKIKKIQDSLNGNVLSWDACKGAYKYRVFIKTGSVWKRLADTKSTSYTHTKAQNGKTYAYTVRCLNSKSKYISTHKAAGWTHKYKKPVPKVTSAANTTSGVTVKWGKVLGAVKYRVFYKTGSTGWKRLADTKNTYYNFTKAKSGTTYQYTVRCINAGGTKYTSSCNTSGYAAKYLSAPKISKLTAAKNDFSITVSWAKVTGAAKYRVFRKAPSAKSWTRLGETTASSYKDTKVASNTAYQYAVRCISSDGKKYTSAYYTSGKAITAPAWVTSVSLDKDDIIISTDDTIYVYATLQPSNAFNKALTWKSSNTAVANAKDGYVWGVAPGTAKITATAHNGKSKTFTLTVRKSIHVEELVGDMLIRASDGAIYDLSGYNTKKTSRSDELGLIAKKVSWPITPAKGENKIAVYDGAYLVIDANDDLYAWGTNSQGRLGIGSTSSTSTPKKILNNVKSVYQFSDMAAAITNSSSLYIWGKDMRSFVNLSYDCLYSPTFIMSNVVKVGLGSSHNAALTASGTMYVWGQNYSKECVYYLNNTPSIIRSPTTAMSNVKDIALGTVSSLAVENDGTLRQWGKIAYGEKSSEPTLGSKYSLLSNVRSVSAYGYNYAAITNNGQLYTWGRRPSYKSSDYKPQQIAKDVKEVMLGETRSMYLSNYNGLYIWGTASPVSIELYK